MSIKTTNSESYRSLGCWLARRVYILYQTLDDLIKEGVTLEHRARAFGEEMTGASLSTESKEDSLGSSIISFSLLAENRRHEKRQLRKDLAYYTQVCPLYRFCREELGLAEGFWSFLVSRCSPFKFNTLGKLIGHLGKHSSKSGKKYKNGDGKMLTKYVWCMRMRKQEPYQSVVDGLVVDLAKKHPDFTESHIKNLAWYKASFDNIIIPYFKQAQVICHSCHNRDGGNGGNAV